MAKRPPTTPMLASAQYVTGPRHDYDIVLTDFYGRSIGRIEIFGATKEQAKIDVRKVLARAMKENDLVFGAYAKRKRK